MLFYLFFLVVDPLAASIGFLFERKENWNLLVLLPIQRLGDHQIMCRVTVKFAATAFKGVIVGWNKLERKTTVTESV